MQAEWLYARSLWRDIQQQPVQLLLRLLGIALAVALVTAVQLSTHSARVSYQSALARFSSGTTHRITAPEGISWQLYRQLRSAPQQWSVWPVVEVPLQLEGGLSLTAYGLDLLIDRRLANQDQQAGRLPELNAQVLAQPGGWLHQGAQAQLNIITGDPFRVLAPGGEQELTLLGSLPDPFNTQWLLMDIGQAQALAARPDRLSYLDLALSSDEATELRKTLPAGVSFQPFSREATPVLGDALYFNLNAMALLALVMGALVVFSTVTLALRQRQPLLASWRLAGLEGGRLQCWIWLELLLLSLVASLLGVLLGLWLAHYLLPVLVASQAAFAAPPLARLDLPAGRILLLVASGVLTTLIAAWRPVRQLSACSPLSLQQPAIEPLLQPSDRARLVRRGWGTVVALLLAVVLVMFDSLWALYGAVVLFSLLALLWCRPLLWGLSTLLSRGSGKQPLLLMVLRDGQRQQVYSTGVMLVLLLTLSSAIAIAGMTASFHSAFQQWIHQRLNADLYIRHSQPLRPLIDSLPRQRGVAQLDARWRTTVRLAGRQMGVYGGDYPAQAQSAYRFKAGDQTTVWTRLQHEPAALISEPMAYHLGLEVGDSFILVEGMPPLDVAGIYYDYGSYQGQLMLDARRFQQYFPKAQPYSIQLWLDDELAVDWLRHLSLLQGAELREARPILERSEQLFEQTFLITDLLQLLLLGIAMVAIAINLLAMQLARRAELQRYRALGMSPALRGGLLLGQALMLASCAALLALPLGELLAWLLTERVQAVAFGWTIPWHYLFSRSATALLAGLLVALLAALYPAFGQEVSDEN